MIKEWTETVRVNKRSEGKYWCTIPKECFDNMNLRAHEYVTITIRKIDDNSMPFIGVLKNDESE